MKKTITGFIVLAVTVFLLAGCSGKGKDLHMEMKDGDSKMSIDADKDGVHYEVKSEDGTMKVVAGKKVDLSNLGIAVYPGAELQNGTEMTNMAGKHVDVKSALLATPDPVSKVADFYMEKLKGAMVVETGGEKPTVILTKEDTNPSVSVTVFRETDENKTMIAISVVNKKGE